MEEVIVTLKQFILKRVLMLSIIAAISVLSGCWNRRELNELGIIGAIAFDLENENTKMTFEVYKPKPIKEGGGESDKERAKYVQSTGESILDTVRNATLKFDRKLFWPHIKAYIFSEEYARKGLMDYLDTFQRDHEARSSVNLLIARGTPASEIMGITGGIEDIPSNYIESLLKAQKANSKTVLVNMRDFLDAYYSKGIQPVAGVVQIRKKAGIGTAKGNGKEEYELIDEGAAVFLNERMVGFLDGIETRGFNFVTGKVKSGVIVSGTPDGGGINSVEIIKAGSKNDVEIEGNHVKITVKIDMEGMLGEEWGKIDLTKPDVFEKIEKANSQVIKQQVEGVIKKVQEEYKSDIFGFGQAVHRKYPGEWEKIQDRWDEIFSGADVVVETKTNITRSGLVSNPMRKEKEQG